MQYFHAKAITDQHSKRCAWSFSKFGGIRQFAGENRLCKYLTVKYGYDKKVIHFYWTMRSDGNPRATGNSAECEQLRGRFLIIVRGVTTSRCPSLHASCHNHLLASLGQHDPIHSAMPPPAPTGSISLCAVYSTNNINIISIPVTLYKCHINTYILLH